MSQATIKDIAKSLNLSPSTISRALRDHPDISSKTKGRVTSYAKGIDYFPDSIAQSLKNGRTKTIGVIVPEIKHDFFSSVVSGIEEIAYQRGFTIILCQSNESYEREVINTKALASHLIAGLLVSISQSTVNGDHFKTLLKRGIPIVFFDRVCEGINASKVVVDDFQGAFDAVEFLIKSGYKKIAHIAGPQNLMISTERMRGYIEALRKYELPVRTDFIIFAGMSEEDGITGLEKLYTLADKPDAVFAVNDPVAIGVYMKIKQLGLQIPKDVGVIGFSNNSISSLINPPLTTVEQPSYEMGKEAAKLLIKQITLNDGNFSAEKLKLKTKLIIRESA